MTIDIKVPSPGESINEVQISTWFVKNGDYVTKNQEIAELESDKATLTLTASESGSITLLVSEGETIIVGSIACSINTDATPTHTQIVVTPVSEDTRTKATELHTHEKASGSDSVKITPLAKEHLKEKGIPLNELLSKVSRIGVKEVEALLESVQNNDNTTTENTDNQRFESRIKLSPLRKKLSQRLVQVKNQTAMLTTFNEINMQPVMQLREKYKESFQQKFGVKLGFMSFFTKAASIALQKHPNINSMIDGEELVAFNYTDIGIAVQTPKGLMVPVLRDVQKKTLAEIELAIATMAQKARDAKLSIDEMSGGTFTITNGGVFGSLLSTPILNPPQAGILGMHNIVERPVAENGQVVIRPMMYVALSYDHRLVDGKDSVGFLVKVKELIEHPERMLFNGDDPSQRLILG